MPFAWPALAASAVAQQFVVAGTCPGGQCPLPSAPRLPVAGGSSPAELHVDDSAIVRITNATAGALGRHRHARRCRRHERTGRHLRAFVSRGDRQRHRHVSQPTCLRRARGQDRQRCGPGGAGHRGAEHRAGRTGRDVSAPGDALVSCGYGGDGRLWCNRGQALGYVTVAGGQNLETLELSGAARFGDSGGPVFDRDHHLVAVLFGTNGRVVDGTFCRRVRRFLAGLSPRFRRGQPAGGAPGVATNPAPPSLAPANPPVASPPPTAPPAVGGGEAERLARLEQLAARLNQGWQTLTTKIDSLVAAAVKAQQAADAAAASAATTGASAADASAAANSTAQPADGGSSAAAPAPSNAGGPPPSNAGGPPPINIVAPPPTNTAPPAAPDPLETVAAPWVSAKLAALLVSFGVPGGIAGVAAGAVVWLVMRRGKQQLQAQLDRVAAASGSATSAASSSSADPAVVQHHNQYVAYETTALDKAWAAAHAHVGEKYPGAVPYLKMVEGVKDQLISGNNDPSLS